MAILKVGVDKLRVNRRNRILCGIIPNAMNRHFVIVLISFCLSGCSMYENGLRNVIHDPHKYAFNLERHKEIKRYRKLARSVLASLDETRSLHFSRGFQDGFVHFMEYGQFGGEPAVPPREYWGLKFQSGPGRAAVELWFSGFAFGEEIAANGHYRDMVTVPGFAPFAGPRHQPEFDVPYDVVHELGEVEYVAPPDPEGTPAPVAHLKSG